MALKFDIEKLKSVRGRVMGYRATFGDLSADGPSPKLAEEALTKKLLFTAENQGTYVFTYGGMIGMVYSMHGAYDYQIIESPGTAMTERVVSTSAGTVHTNRYTAAAELRHAMAQRLYKANEPALRDELETWLKRSTYVTSAAVDEFKKWADFQDRYATAKFNGLPDEKAYKYATNDPSVRLSEAAV